MSCVVHYEFEVASRINGVINIIEGAIKDSELLNSEEPYLTPYQVASIYSGLIDVISYDKTPDYTKVGVLSNISLLTDLIGEGIICTGKERITAKLKHITDDLSSLSNQVRGRKVTEVIY